MIRAEILTVGSELLQGKTSNTNAQYLSEQLTGLGICVDFHSTCDDQIDVIARSLQLACQRADLIMVTGGLGPTPDDVTREAVCKCFQTDLEFNRAQYQRICTLLKKIGKKPTELMQREACFPKIGTPILNQIGIALGFFIKQNEKLVVVLPGVPREMENLFQTKVRRLIAETFGKIQKKFSLSASIAGMGEAEMMERLGKNFFSGRNFEFGSYPMDGRIVLRLRAHDKRLIQALKRDLRSKLKEALYSFSEESLEAYLAKRLIQKRKTVAVAESCTGGLLSKRLTDTSGASAYFLGSIIAYQNHVKEKFLSVPHQILKTYGAVSGETALQMARSARDRFKSDFGISVTGIAGPGGGSSQKPVGLVWIALAAQKNRKMVRKFNFVGDRTRIRRLATERALWMLYCYFNRHK